MNLTQKNMIAGIYLANLIFRVQLDNLSNSMSTADEIEFRETLKGGEPSFDQMTMVNEALDIAITGMREHFGILQATRLHSDLLTGGVLSTVTKHLVEDPSIDWDAVGAVISVVAKRFRIDDLINPLLDRQITEGSIYKGAYVKAQMELGVRYLQCCLYSESSPRESVHQYAQLWVTFFNDSEGLMNKLNEVGVKTGMDDSEDIHAIHNLMRGQDDGGFECFCIGQSLGAELAQEWEGRMVGWGHYSYRGAFERAQQYVASAERHAFIASAHSLGYPVYFFEPPTADFDDLIVKIPGGIHPEEARLIVSLIQSTAHCLFFELCGNDERKKEKWRGLRLSSSLSSTDDELEFEEGSGWMPLIRHKAMRFTNRRFDRDNREPTPFIKEGREWIEAGKQVNNKLIYASRIDYLVQELLRVIEDEFYALKFF